MPEKGFFLMYMWSSEDPQTKNSLKMSSYGAREPQKKKNK